MPRTSSWRSAASIGAAAFVAFAPALRAQDTTQVGPYARAVATWIALIAAPGYERQATERITSAVPGWTRDRMGNLIKVVGDSAPRRVIACGLDESGFVVSQITDDGYLRVHLSGNEHRVALWPELHEGQRVIVQAIDRANPGRLRNVPGVFAVRSNHLWRHRTEDTLSTSIENLWVDVGARTRAEAERMGVQVLDPVVRDWPEWTYGDFVAGPGAANRAGCEAVAAAAASSKKPATGQTIFIISTEKSFEWAGLTPCRSHASARASDGVRPLARRKTLSK